MNFFYLLCFSIFSISVSAQSVSLDPTFDNDGIAIANLSTSNQNTAFIDSKVQQDGKVLCAGYFSQNGQHNTLLMRYNTDGTPDNSFGSNGIAAYTLADRKMGVDCIALQQDGKIIAAGDLEETENTVGTRDCFVARYKTDGTLDSSFGTDGITFIHLVDGQDEMASVLVQPDGKIVATSNSYYPAGGAGTLFRLNTDGSRDMNFGSNSVTKILALANNSTVYNSIQQQDGKILLCGSAIDYGGTGYKQMMMARLKPNGEYDSSFGNNGIKVLIPQGGFDYIFQVVVLPDKKIIGAGSVSISGGSLLALVKVDESGRIDSTFGINGFVTALPFNHDNNATDIALQNDGKILVCGIGDSSMARADMFLMRFNSNGSSDNSFGTNGLIVTDPITAEESQATTISLYGNRIYVGGFTFSLDLVTPYKGFINAYRNDAFPLAFQLLNFTATKNKNNNLLNWQTADETATSMFVIQKSNDGIHYRNAATVSASGDVSGNNYQFTDSAAGNETIFYRLKILSNDGSYKYSKTIVLHASKTNGNLTLFPNPAVNSITVQSKKLSGNVVIFVTDINGRKCREFKRNIILNTAFPVELNRLASGIYYLHITGKEIDEVQQFIKK